MKFDPTTDLKLERELAVPLALVWEAWTQPKHIKEWFCPKPWRVVECDIDLQPGGVFRFVMEGPAGERNEHVTCYLAVENQKRLVWSTAMHPGFRPAPVSKGVPDFTAVIEFTSLGASKTRYVATAMHRDQAGSEQHARMGFLEGWGICADQLEALMAR